MTQPQYGWAHQQQRAALAPIVNAGDAYCTEIVCVMRTRWIAPGAPWDLAHDRTTGGYLGPAHARCNRREGAAHGNRTRHAPRGPQQAPRAPTAGRWGL